jgi:hypothetical protein
MGYNYGGDRKILFQKEFPMCSNRGQRECTFVAKQIEIMTAGGGNPAACN